MQLQYRKASDLKHHDWIFEKDGYGWLVTGVNQYRGTEMLDRIELQLEDGGSGKKTFKTFAGDVMILSGREEVK